MSRPPTRAELTEPATEENFDAARYIAANPDIARHVDVGGDARQHFIDHGAREGRRQARPGCEAALRPVSRASATRSLLPPAPDVDRSTAARPDRSGLPAEFDAAHYRSLHPDIAELNDQAARAHYDRHGRSDGRVASPAALREGFLEQVLGRVDGTMLEIGPFCRPLVRGPHVRYLDVMDATALRQRAVAIGLDPAQCPQKIDYIGDLADIDDRFAAVVSSHAIEHQPDLVHHLQEVGRLLQPRGHYYLIVPDKRFCFDALIPESTIAGVLYAHEQRRTVHSLQSVIEHRALVTHNNGERHWNGRHGPIAPEEAARRATRAMQEFVDAKGAYIDVHAWYWTPASFRRILMVLYHMGLSPLRPIRVYDTPRPRFEFCAVLANDERPGATPVPGTA